MPNRHPFLLPLALLFHLPPSKSNILTPHPSANTTILHETPLTIGYTGHLSISADVPVTIQRYSDIDGTFVYGSHPVESRDVRVVVTSDCDSTQTTVVPVVEFDFNSSVLGVKLNVTGNHSFMESSWYEAFWSYTYSFFYATTTSTVEAVNLTEELMDLENNVTLDGVEVTTSAATAMAQSEGETVVEALATQAATPAAGETSQEITVTGATNADVTTPAADDDAPVTRCPGDGEESEEVVSNGELVMEIVESPGFTFRRSFVLQTITTFVILFTTNVLFTGMTGMATLFHFGKVAVGAVAISALFSKTNRQNKQQHTQHTRQLQTCNYNVDILLDGCSNSFTVNAPSARVIDAVVVNLTYAENANDTRTTDYEAILTFPVTENTTLLTGNNGTVQSFECSVVMEGRPFVDVKGKSLLADSLIGVGDSWLGCLNDEDIVKRTGNETEHNMLLLGEEWTKRALAEHASIASFSAFSVALMTNAAPRILVEDALNAALDEVRHAKVSFDIASMLTGKDVGPGALPPSNLEFEQDLTALGLAVAKEGCVDETLSAFIAVLEANEINDVIQSGKVNKKYIGVGHDTLTLIRDELRKIAMEESNHSVLAWRTVSWICNVDSNACSILHEQVFNRDHLNTRIRQVLSNKQHDAFQLIQEEWEKILSAHRLKSGLSLEKDGESYEQPVCYGGSVEMDSNELPLISQLTENIRSGVMC